MLKASILDGPRMLKPLNSKFWRPKVSNSKVLTSGGHLSGWLDAKSFDFGWSRMLKPSNSMFWCPKTSYSKVCGHLSGWLHPEYFNNLGFKSKL